MGHPKPPRRPLESSADEVPTQILSQRPGEEYGDDDGNTIEHREEPTVRADVDTEQLRAKAPPLAMQPKVPRPAAYAGPATNEFLEAIEPLEGDNTEVANQARLVAVEHPADREQSTAILPVPPPKIRVPTPAMAMTPAAIPSSAPSSRPSARAGAFDDDSPYELPGLEPPKRGKWLAAALLLVVLVGVGGVAIGRLSAKRVPPAASSAAAKVTGAATASTAPTEETRDTIPPPSPAPEQEPVAAAAPAPAPVAVPSIPHAAPAPRPHIAPHPAPAPRAHPAPSGVIVRDAPF